MNKKMKYSSVLNFLCISSPRRCLDSQTIRDLLSDDNDQLPDVSGGGDDREEDKTYVPWKALLGLSSSSTSSDEDDLIDGKN